MTKYAVSIFFTVKDGSGVSLSGQFGCPYQPFPSFYDYSLTVCRYFKFFQHAVYIYNRI